MSNPNLPEHKNLIVAVALSLVIVVAFEFLWPKPPAPPAPVQQTVENPAGGTAPAASTSAPAVPGGPVSVPQEVARDQALASSPRLPVETPSLRGSLSLVGSRIDDLTLVKYRESTAANAPQVTLFSPKGSPLAYYAELGWVAGEAGVAVPGSDTEWTLESQGALTPERPVTLSWSNGNGLTFTRVISIDADYLLTATDTVRNDGAAAVTLHPYGLIARGYTPKTEDFYILHEGPLGVLDGTLKEHKYKDLAGDNGKIEQTSTGGWVGITDKYWLAALDLDNDTASTVRFLHTKTSTDRYQVDYLGAGRAVAPGQSITVKTDVFAGAKVLDLLDRYAAEKNIDRFELAIDFGWFFFLTKPFFHILTYLHGLLGNFGLAILAFTVLLRGVMFPLANKSYKSMSAMKRLQPELKVLQERFSDDRARLNQEMMALYKKEGANPLSGCLPIIIQIPIFFALYKVLFVSIEMRHAPFYGWIKDLSAPDPTTVFNLFGLIPWTPPQFLHLGILPLLMGITMWLQQKLNPQPADPIQARIMMLLPVVFTFMLAGFPAGLVIYWTWSNVLSIAQQWAIMRKYAEKKPA